MKKTDNRGRITLRRKTFLIAGAVVLTLVLLAWVFLIVGVLKNGKKSDGKKSSKGKANGKNVTAEEYQIPEVPKGYVLVFRKTEHYSIGPNGERALKFSREYDENGLCTAEIRYSDDGPVRQRRNIYTYDEEGRTKSCTKYYMVDEWKKSELTTYEYDDRGIIRKESTNYYDYDDDMEYTVLYNENGDMTERRNTVAGHDTFLEKRIYDDNGRLTEIRTNVDRTVYLYGKSGQKLKRTIYEISGGKISEEVFLSETESKLFYYDDEGNRQLYKKREYDEYGNIVHETAYNMDGSVMHEGDDLVCEYDEKGNPTKYISVKNGVIVTWDEWEQEYIGEYEVGVKYTSKDENGKIQYVLEKKYDSDGHITEKSICDRVGNANPVIYSEYDSYGNALRTIEITDGLNKTVTDEMKYIPLAIPEIFATEYDLREK